jgi:hypothetical protein
MSSACRDCREGLDHCHGTIIRHTLSRPECTEPDCDGPELLPHIFVVDCDAVGCTCTESALAKVAAASAHRIA